MSSRPSRSPAVPATTWLFAAAGPEAEGPDAEPTVVARRRRPPPPPPNDDVLDGQLSFDEPAEYRPPRRRS